MAAIPETSTSLVLEDLHQPLSVKKTPTQTTPPPGTALVKIISATVRPHQRGGFNGKKALPFPVPYTPGNSAVARILAVGFDAVTLQPGQLVWVNGFIASRDDPEGTKIILGLTDLGGGKPGTLFQAWPGLWRDVASIPLENCLPLDEDALCNKLGYSFGDLAYIDRLTVANGGIRAAELRPGETVVISPATGHYSGASAELAAQLGCRVIALTRNAAKLQPLASRYPRMTALEVTGDASTDSIAIRALLPPGSSGVDALIDTSPPEATASPSNLTAGLDALRPGGRAVFMGALGDISISYMSLMFRSITIKGQWMYSREWAIDLIKSIEMGIIKLGQDAGHEVVDGGFALEDWEKAIVVAEEATQWGRQVLFMP